MPNTDVIELTQAQILEIAAKAVQMYAEKHPRPVHVNTAQACEMVGKSYPVIKRLLDTGKIKLNKFGLIPVSEVDKVIASFQ